MFNDYFLVKNLGGHNLWRPHRIDGWQDKKIRSVVSGPCACHSVFIDEEGKAYTFGEQNPHLSMYSRYCVNNYESNKTVSDFHYVISTLQVAMIKPSWVMVIQSVEISPLWWALLKAWTSWMLHVAETTHSSLMVSLHLQIIYIQDKIVTNMYITYWCCYFLSRQGWSVLCGR